MHKQAVLEEYFSEVELVFKLTSDFYLFLSWIDFHQVLQVLRMSV